MDGEQGMFRRNRFGVKHVVGAIALVGIAATYLLALANAAPGPSSQSKKNDAVTLEAIPGGAAKRVILSAKASERLGIETGTVSKDTVVREQMVGGVVIPRVDILPEAQVVSSGFAGFAQGATVPAPQPAVIAPAPTDGEVWIRVTLSAAEYERLAKDQPARIESLQTREKLAPELVAQPVAMAPIEDVKRSMLTLYYSLPAWDHGLALNQRVRVGLALSGSTEPETVVPYAAVYYDAQGVAWVYVTSKDLAFERQPVVIDRVVGDVAVLSEGPAAGTKVVTVGAALLYGAEVFGK